MESNATPVPRTWPQLLRGAVLLVLLVALVLLLRAVSVQRSLAWLTLEVHALGPWGPLAFAAVFIILTLALVPATPVVLAAGAVFGPVVATLTISLASTVSAALSFLTSRYVAHDRVAAVVSGYPRVRLVWRALGEREGWKIVAAVRLSHFLPFGVQSLLFGLSPVRFWPFVAATWLAMMPGTLLYTYLGFLGAAALGGEDGEPPGPSGWGLRLASLAVIALALVYVIHFARRTLRQASRESAPTYR